MKIRDTIEKQLIREVRQTLDEMDIEGMVRDLLAKNEVKAIINRLIQDRIANEIQDRTYMQIRKLNPIMDEIAHRKAVEFIEKLK